MGAAIAIAIQVLEALPQIESLAASTIALIDNAKAALSSPTGPTQAQIDALTAQITALLGQLDQEAGATPAA